MKSKFYKKLLAFSLTACMLVTAVKWPLAVSAQTETAVQAEDFILSDDFSDSEHTGKLWTNDLKNAITEDQNVELSGQTDTYLISDAMWDEGNKPTKFGFTAYTSTYSGNWPDGGVRVQLLHTESANLEFSINTAQAQGFHKYIATGFTSDRGDETRIFRATEAGSNQTTPFTYTFTYDWSRWDEVTEGEQPQVTITLEAFLKDKKKYTDTITFVCTAENKPDTFNAGFKSEKETTVIDDVSLEYQVSNSTLKGIVADKYAAFIECQSYTNASAYLKYYKLLSLTSQTDMKMSYNAVCNWLKGQSDAYNDDFSNADKSDIMWSNNPSNNIESDAMVLSGDTESYLISDAMWDEGNKPVKFSFTAYAVEQINTYHDDGLRIHLLYSDTVQLDFSLNTAQSGGYLAYRATGLTPAGATRLWQGESDKLLNKENKAGTFTFTFDWSKWNEVAAGEKPQVTVTATVLGIDGVNFSNSISTTFTYTGEQTPQTFKVGYKNNCDSFVLDDVKVGLQVSDATVLQQSLVEKYEAFKEEQTYANANAYMKVYQLLADSAKASLNGKVGYQEVSAWLKSQTGAYTDDFSNLDKTSVLWTNGLQDKITKEGSVELSGARDTHLISDTMWDENNRPTQFSFAAYTKESMRNDTGLSVLLLQSENVSLELRINTAQQGTYHKYYFSGLEADTNALRLWQNATQITSNTDFVIYTFTYDWSMWDEKGEVKVVADAVGNNQQKVATKTITFTCTQENKPATLKVGFANLQNTTVLDDVQLKYENPETEQNALVARGATISTDFSDGAMIRMGFDYSTMKKYLAGTGEKLVNYGAVLVSREANAEEMKAALRNAHETCEETSGVRRFQDITYVENGKYMITVGGADATADTVPSIYNLAIKGSNNIDKGYIDRNICAVGYVITQAEDETYHYYFTNTEDANKNIHNGMIQKSVMELLYTLNGKLLAEYESADETSKTVFKNIVESFDTSGAVSIADYEKVVRNDMNSMDIKVQKKWLEYVYVETQKNIEK